MFGVNNSYFWMLVFLRLGVRDFYVCELGILMFGV